MIAISSPAKAVTVAATALSMFAGVITNTSAQNTVRPIVLARGGPVPDSSSTSSASKSSSSKPATTPAPVAGATFPPRPNTTKSAATNNVAAAGAATTTGAVPDGPTPRALPPAGRAMMSVDFDTPLPDEKVLHLVVGHSLFIDTRHRLSRVYITNPDVLNSYTASPNQVVLTAKQAGQSNLIVWDEVGDTKVYMVSAETNVDGLSGAIKKAFPTEDIELKGGDGRITLTGTVGTQATADAVAKLAALYGKDISNALFVSSSKIKQVRLKVRFAEVDRSRIQQFGFNLFAILNGNGANATLATSTTGAFPGPIYNAGGTSTSTSTSSGGYSVGGQSVTVSNPLNFVLYNASHNIGATIQDLEDKQIMHILAEPNITTLSGQKANFLAGGEFPFPVVQGGTAGSTSAVTIVFKPFGVKLEFVPLVNSDGTIDLTVAPEVSALDYTNAVTVSGFTIPALSTRRASTQVVLRNGQSFAISGLLDQRTTDALGRTPGVASIPILGALFRSKNINHSNSELIVIVTPEIVDPLSDHPEENKLPTSPVPLIDPLKFDQALPNSVKKPSAAR